MLVFRLCIVGVAGGFPNVKEISTQSRKDFSSPPAGGEEKSQSYSLGYTLTDPSGHTRQLKLKSKPFLVQSLIFFFETRNNNIFVMP